MTRDITERRRAEADTERLSQRLLQAEKMEAIGTLAGGIAHDFNNILGAILGYIDLARMDVRDGLPVEDSLLEIRKAADRAKALVRQILTFSRQDAHERDVIELPPIVSEATRFLRATISAVVSMDVAIDPSVPQVVADANQIHQLFGLHVTGNNLTVRVDVDEIVRVQTVNVVDIDTVVDVAKRKDHAGMKPPTGVGWNNGVHSVGN